MAAVQSSAAAVRSAHIVALMVTRRCNMTCAHCSVESGPGIRDEPSLAELLARVTAIGESGAHLLLLTGGEPMLRQKDVFAVIRHARQAGMTVAMATNGFWANTPANATRMVRRLHRAGLITLTISPDQYHAPFQGIDVSLNIARAAALERIPLNVNLMRTGDGDPGLTATVKAFEKQAAVQNHVSVRFFDVQPVGRARDLGRLRGETGGSCLGCSVPAVTDDGRVTACNGPSYFAPAGSPLNLGSLNTHSLQSLLEQHATDPILDTIRTFGVERLRDELLQIDGFGGFPLRAQYGGMCELCAQITSDGAAVAALRSHLSQETLAAERQARRMIVAAQRRETPRHYVTVNSVERARIFWPALRGEAWSADGERILSRADFDWKRAAEYFSACGLARVVEARLGDRPITRWAPKFFAELIRARAMADALREFVVRDILDELDGTLAEIGANGVLLKSAAMMARRPRGGAGRAGSDVDIWVPAGHARDLQTRLLAHGWAGVADHPRTAAHHLAPISRRGVLVEVHTRLLPGLFGLPEPAMLGSRRSLEGYRRLETLDPAGEMLLAAVHSSSHLFSHGLKTAWDIAECAASDGVDWERLASWVDRMTLPRAFWSVVNAVSRECPLRLPPSFAARAPRDLKQLRLEGIARRRVFSVLDVAEELNPFSKNALFLLMGDSAGARARVLVSLLGRDARDARRTNWQWRSRETAVSTPTHLRAQVAEAWQQWKDYQKLVTSEPFRERVERVLATNAEGSERATARSIAI
jgi:hypothetical protein